MAAEAANDTSLAVASGGTLADATTLNSGDVINGGASNDVLRKGSSC